VTQIDATTSGRARVAIIAAACGVALLTSLFLRTSLDSNTRSKVIVIGVDGASHKILFPLVEQGRMPNLARFLTRASGGLLDSPVDKYESAALWTTIVTGLNPERHGVLDFVMAPENRDGPLGRKDPQDPNKWIGEPPIAVTSGHRRAKALWNILPEFGKTTTVIGLWATWPAERIDGIVITDRVTYSRMRMSTTFRQKDGTIVPFDFESTRGNFWPLAFGRAVERSQLVRTPDELEPETLRRFADFTEAEVDAILRGRFEGNFNQATDSLQELKLAVQSDRSYIDLAFAAERWKATDLTFLYLEGVDAIEHKFFQYHAGTKSGLGPERERLNDVVRNYYVATDEWIGALLDRAGPDTTVIIVSDHGYDVLPPQPPRADGTKDEREHWHDRNSIFFARGGPILERATVNLGRSITDVTPTILALLGIPVADDLDGQVMVELFDPDRLDASEIRRTASFGGRVRAWYPDSGSEDDEALIDRLKGLGYLGGVSDS
jgi:predicted AlkP superfamily phosphohydrolase/phosphomutase